MDDKMLIEKIELMEPDLDTSFEELRSVHLLVHWVGSCPKQYDIITSSNLMLDDINDTPGLLEPDAIIMVKCGIAKSPAKIISISDDTNYLNEEMARLRALEEVEDIKIEEKLIETEISKRPRSRSASLEKCVMKSKNFKKSIPKNPTPDRSTLSMITPKKEKLEKSSPIKSTSNKSFSKKSSVKKSFLKKKHKASPSIRSSTPISSLHIRPSTLRKAAIKKVVKKEKASEEKKDKISEHDAYENLKSDYEKMKDKYQSLKQKYDDILGNLKNLIQTTEEDDNESKEDIERKPKVTKKRALMLIPSNLQQNVFRPPGFRSYAEIMEKDKVLIGSGKTPVPRAAYLSINWLSYSAATRKLLMSIFSRETLASHNLSGKPSPVFVEAGIIKQPKVMLDPIKVADIVEIVSVRCGVTESMVRNAITTKCADEHKMYKKRTIKDEVENIPHAHLVL